MFTPLKPLLMLMILGMTTHTHARQLPEGFVDVQSLLPHVVLDIRYFSEDNFVGTPIDGYQAAKCIVSTQAAAALVKVQNNLKDFGLGLKIFDCYRPQKAVDHFVRWAVKLTDKKMKARYYPQVAKSELFSKGYIAEKSGHSRGSTVDLTLVSLQDDKALDMGSGWDFFSPISWPSSVQVNTQQRANRMLLQQIMTRHGFKPLKEEWWHFTLKNEPYPQRYFDFSVE